MDSSKAPDDFKLGSLSTSIEKLQIKARAFGELDTEIAGEILAPEELKRDVYEVIRVFYFIL